MKRLLDLFRTEGQEKKGWLRIKGKTLAHDKQKHIVLGILIYLVALVYFWLYEGQALEYSTEDAFLITFLVSFGWEIFGMTGWLRKKTMFNFTDIIATVFIPLAIHLLILY